MARPLALFAAVALALGPAAARGEPLDLSLVKLGAPSPAVWQVLDARDNTVALSAAEAQALADEAKLRFATLSLETALAFSSAVMQPGSTTGVAGWNIGFEGTYAPVHSEPVGTTTFGTGANEKFGPRSPWQTKAAPPTELVVAGLHVRKALPYSFELGGRFSYLSQSQYAAAQVEAKWAMLEGFLKLPDVALRGAYTAVIGQRDWNLSTYEADLLVSKRFGLDAMTAVTPWLAGRWNRVTASSEVLDFQPTNVANPTPAQLAESQAAFPELSASLWRVTLGARLSRSTFSAALEGTYVPSTTVDGAATPSADQYPDVPLQSSWAVTFRFGWEL